MGKLTRAQCILYIEDVYEEFKRHTLAHLTSSELSEVDDKMAELVALLTGD